MIATFDEVTEAKRRRVIARGRELSALVENGQRLTPEQVAELDGVLAWLQDYNDTAERENKACTAFMAWARSLPGVDEKSTVEEVMRVAKKLGDDRYQLINGCIVENAQTKGGEAPKQSCN